jgi:hypothetical protein
MKKDMSFHWKTMNRTFGIVLLIACTSVQAQMLPRDHPLCVKRSDIERFANAWVDEDKTTIQKMSGMCKITKRDVIAIPIKRDGYYVQVMVNAGGSESAPLWTIKDGLRP